uniref:exodeoxyribonuclease V subunit gamma n=1 Tax=Vibrio cholerae TaxID=666 RepID=UPI003F58F792
MENYLQESLHLSHAVGNSLLASMGKMGRDNLYLLAQNDQSELELFIDIQRDSLLHHIQADILHLQEHQDDAKFASSGHKPSIAAQDDSCRLPYVTAQFVKWKCCTTDCWPSLSVTQA